jgi:transposase
VSLDAKRIKGDFGSCRQRPVGVDSQEKTYRAAQKDREDVRQRTDDFNNIMQGIKTNQLVFVDEAGCQLGMDRRYARSQAGERAHCKRFYHHGDTNNLIGAVAEDGLRCLWEVTGTVNGEMFTAFIKNGLASKLRPNDVVVLDNLPGHKVYEVREAIEKSKAHLVFLPPYSPERNPIELLWSKFKEIIRGIAPRTQPPLAQPFVRQSRR